MWVEEFLFFSRSEDDDKSTLLTQNTEFTNLKIGLRRISIRSP